MHALHPFMLLHDWTVESLEAKKWLLLSHSLLSHSPVTVDIKPFYWLVCSNQFLIYFLGIWVKIARYFNDNIFFSYNVLHDAFLLPLLSPVSASPPVCPACSHLSVSLVPHVFKLLSGLSNAVSFTCQSPCFPVACFKCSCPWVWRSSCSCKQTAAAAEQLQHYNL